MSSSSDEVRLRVNRKRVQSDADVILAYASTVPIRSTIPTAIPLGEASGRQHSAGSSEEVDLLTYRADADLSSFDRQSQAASQDSDCPDQANSKDLDSGDLEVAPMNFRLADPKSPGPGLGQGIILDNSNAIQSDMTLSKVRAIPLIGGRGGIDVICPGPDDRPWSPPAGYIRTDEEEDRSEGHHYLAVEEEKGRRIFLADFLSWRIKRSYPRISSGNWDLPLEEATPEPIATSTSARKGKSSHSKKSSTQSRLVRSPMGRIEYSVMDSDEEFDITGPTLPSGREGLRPEKASVTHEIGKGLMWGLLSDSRRSEADRLQREEEKRQEERKKRNED
ncbi:hypothetical protein AALP_AA2G050500 [Arabis alpina]|uniref:Uncharacterized protein n=1 Tax=Arabis alpina TaxID=50452 RepID=A0A087HFF4_ARAAL|nr:hypothetical protein AALP_AA2G050500 [Arabis alpina]